MSGLRPSLPKNKKAEARSSIEYNREGRNERTVRISTERNASVLDGAWCDELETVEMYANGATYAAPRANRA
jgi:hypothetical protein